MTGMNAEPTAYRPCVGLMVINRDGGVWVGRRVGAPDDAEGNDTWWQMPQGGIDEGEDARQAAIRELREETGMETIEVIGETAGWVTYDLPEHLIGKAWGGKYRGQKQRWFAMRFLGQETEIRIDPPPGGHSVEFDRWRWASVDELLGMVVPFKRGVYRQVLAELGGLARPLGD
ncbi:MAG: RNA pyrophosphohydrolase [Hyphomicrobiaceae bacterium]